MAPAVLATVVSSMALAVAGKTVPMDSKHAAEAFNTIFTGHGPAKGIYMKLGGDWELFCGGPCFKGRPDCQMSAALWNYQLGVDNVTHFFTGTFEHAPKAGVVFNADMVERELAKCYFYWDAGTNERYNGGCGCMAPQKDVKCDSPFSPYHNVAPDGKFVDGDHPQALNCHCTSEEQGLDTNPFFAPTCFWRGPAYNTSHGRFGRSEVEHVVNQRLNFQAKHPGDGLKSTMTDEVVLDGSALQHILAIDPASAVHGVFFYTPQEFPTAQRIQRTFLSKYGVELPIVHVSNTVAVSAEKGPFSEYDPAMFETASPGLDLEAVVV